jgi:hydroxymethylpyrimidine/phosphomethylpyrimidine kinase
MPNDLPCALAVGGLDPGGGAGILADLRAFAAAGAFGCAVVAVSTIQSIAGLKGARAIASVEVVSQVTEILKHQRVTAVKVGALGSRGNVLAIAKVLSEHPGLPVVVDTPMLPTRGRARLLNPRALGALRADLLPLATLLTVNVAEAQLFLGERVRTISEAHDAARALVTMGPRAVLVKGGHLEGAVATDVLAIGPDVIELRARRLDIGATHGTGCTLASLVAGRLAWTDTKGSLRRDALIAAVRWAKRAHHASLTRAVSLGRGVKVMIFR